MIDYAYKNVDIDSENKSNYFLPVEFKTTHIYLDKNPLNLNVFDDLWHMFNLVSMES